MHIKDQEIYRDSKLMPHTNPPKNMKVWNENSLQVYIIKRALHIKIYLIFFSTYISLHLRVYDRNKGENSTTDLQGIS